MMADDNGLANLNKAFDRLGTEPVKKIRQALVTSGTELAEIMQTFAQTSRDTGALIRSIEVTAPGETTPAYGTGGERVAGPNEVIVTAGNTDVRYAHLVEFGTAKAEAKPFFWVAHRLTRKRTLGRINRAARKAVSDAWKGRTSD